MRFLQYIASLLLLGCSGIVQKNPTLKSNYWISEKFEYYPKDSITGIELIYGSAYLLKLDSNQQAKFFSGDFYWENDSLYQGGEPGRTMKIGKWRKQDSILILTQELIEKTIMLTTDKLGQIESDTLKIKNDSIIFYKRDKLIPLKCPSRELRELMERDWEVFKPSKLSE